MVAGLRAEAQRSSEPAVKNALAVVERLLVDNLEELATRPATKRQPRSVAA